VRVKDSILTTWHSSDSETTNELTISDWLSERQREGIAVAKRRGVYRGRKQALSPGQVTQLRQRALAGETKAQLARAFGISRETLYQYLRRPTAGLADSAT
jgi:DNA invertase Pin-like site-specific DNA recombinase